MVWNKFKKITPKKTVRKFTDLEVYQKTLDASVILLKDILPKLEKLEFSFAEQMVGCAVSIPLWLSQAHSMRFYDHEKTIGILEQAMAGCNKMVVYLDQIKGVYGKKLDGDLINDLSGRYADVRTKIFRLEKSWQKWYAPRN